jgi:predicted DNA-binding protein (MmcQ/YjbR family)
VNPDNHIVDRVRTLCLSFPAVEEDMPFDESTLVYKVGGKMFCLLNAIQFKGCALKCDPERALELRASFEGVDVGPYLNRRHWNYVWPVPTGDVPWQLFEELVKDSYTLVYQGLTRSVRSSVDACGKIESPSTQRS